MATSAPPEIVTIGDARLRVRSADVEHVDVDEVARLSAALRRREWNRLPSDLAELLQHEIDHLDGVLMVDRAIGADAIRPIEQRGALVESARPSHRLSLERIADAARTIDPVFLHSPQFV